MLEVAESRNWAIAVGPANASSVHEHFQMGLTTGKRRFDVE